MTPCPSCTTPFVPERRKLHLCPTCRSSREEKASQSRAAFREMKEAPIPCLRCQKPYERKGATGTFCPPCYEARDREERNERRKRAKQEAQEMLSSRPDWMLDDLGEEFWESALIADDGSPALVPDRMPVGFSTAAGPDEGRSTFFSDLRGELDTLSKDAAKHPWWKANKHWAHELGKDLEHVKYELAPGLKCGDQQGEYAGYKRHKNAKEAACPECTEAKRLYIAGRRKRAVVESQ